MIELTLTARDLAHVRFAYSPLWEVVASVRALKDPAGSPHRPWIEAVAPRLRAARLDLAILTDLVPVPTRVIPAFIAPPPTTTSPPLSVELAAMRASTVDSVLEGLGQIPPTPALAAFRADPRGGLARLSDAIERYWDVALAPYWARIKALYDGDILHRARLLAEGGVRRLFAELDPAIAWDGERLTIDTVYADRRVDADGLGLLLTPSVFSGPRVFSLIRPRHQPTVRYRPRGTGLLWTPARHLASDALSAVLGRSRARLLSELDGPESTTSLAARTGLTAAAVSQHLKALLGAGIVDAHRDGRYVLYARTDLGERLAGGGRRP